MSIAGRSTLICSCLNNSPIYQMSVYMCPKTISEKIDKIRRTFFWQGGGTKKKYHLVKWVNITKPKDKGGLGIKDLRTMNISLLCKWWWKAENGTGIWQEIVSKKYLKKGGIVFLKKSNKNSPVWNDLLKVRHIYLKGRSMIVGNGKSTSFWHDRWCGLVSLAEKFPRLYEINKEQECSVEIVRE